MMMKMAVLIAIAGPLAAQETPPATADAAAPPAPIVVGTKAAPPFAMQDEAGAWTGLSVELWQAIAASLGRISEFKVYDNTDALVEAAAKGEIDAGVAATSITAEREKIVDFSHPFYQSGLAIAVSTQGGSGLFDIFKALVSPAFLTTVGTLLALLLVIGALMWVVERKQNWDQFNREAGPGIGDGFWWSAVTMTTVGYGDKAPITLLGRIIAVIWMFAALILTAVFTAQLASSLTVDKISGPVSGIADLPRARVGIVAKSATKEYFAQRKIQTIAMDTVAEGLEALNEGSIDAFVHDEPILKYEISNAYQGRLDVLPQVFNAQDYAIVLPVRSPNREAINQALLAVMGSNTWTSAREKYFGATAE